MSKDKSDEGMIKRTNSDIGFHEEILDQDLERDINVRMQKLIREHSSYPEIEENQETHETIAVIKNTAGNIIRSVQDWYMHAPPAQGIKHWVDGRSAKELAKAWFRSGEVEIPQKLLELLDTNECTSAFEMNYAIPELETKLDAFGKGRCHDLVIYGEATCGKTLVTVEAKVDENFGEVISEYVEKNLRINPRSKLRHRVDYLSKGLFNHQNIELLRYQLLHGIAGTLIAASEEKASQCVFVVHELVPVNGKSSKAISNDADLRSFVKLLTGSELQTGKLIGPLHVPGNSKIFHNTIPGNIPLYIGKFQTGM